MGTFIRLSVFLALPLLIIGCVTQQQLDNAINRVDDVWKQQNDSFLEAEGVHSYAASFDQAFLAAQSTLR